MEDTPLFPICYRVVRAILLRLIQDCDIRCEDGEGNIPLHYACEGNYIDIIELMTRSLLLPLSDS